MVIKKLRKKYGYTQERLAGLSDVAYKHIQRLESKKPTGVRLDTLEKIAKAFGRSISEFLNF